MVLMMGGCHCGKDRVRAGMVPLGSMPQGDPNSTPAARSETSTVIPVKNPIRLEPPKTIPDAIRDPEMVLDISKINSQLVDAYFAYDRSDAAAEAVANLKRDADLLTPILAEVPSLHVVVQGHCDERGSAEYNLALGDRRAARAADILKGFGVPAAAMRTISCGKEMPQCTDPSESCWQLNRRAHLVLAW